MKKSINNTTFKLTLSAAIAAVSLVLMFLTGMFPLGTFALPCIAGVMITSIVIECGYKWAVAVYVVVAILAFVISSDKEAALYFVMLFGYYPLLKGIFEGKIKSKTTQYILKFAVFNVAVVAAFLLTTFFLSVPAEEFTIAGFYVPWVFLIAGNIFFIIYDKAVTSIITLYIHRFRGKLFGKK